jgi:hypothetical protein
LRHTAATLALAAGVSPKIISEQLGHASVAFTLDVYSHVLPHMQDAAAEKVETLLVRSKTDAKPRQAVAGLTPVADFRNQGHPFSARINTDRAKGLCV